MTEIGDELAEAIEAARCAPGAVAAVESLYEKIGREVSLRQPRCDISGRCCRFEEYGHRLYVTTLELAAFVSRREALPEGQSWDGMGCPFQRNKLCGVHAIRPMGCRMFYCDPSAQDWQQEHYEVFHSQLKQLHDAMGVKYFYVEWRSALEQLGLAGKNR